MKLSIDEIKKYLGKNIDKDSYYTYKGEFLLNLIDTIEAQQQEIEILKEALSPLCSKCIYAWNERFKNYNNPADVEAMGWAREFIERVYNGLYESCPTGDLTQEQFKYAESVQEWQGLLDAALGVMDKAILTNAKVDNCYTCKKSMQNEELGQILDAKDRALNLAKEAIDIMCFEYFAFIENGYRRCRQCQMIDSHRPACETGKALAAIEQIGGGKK